VSGLESRVTGKIVLKPGFPGIYSIKNVITMTSESLDSMNKENF
jgi:hypothetical protein